MTKRLSSKLLSVILALAICATTVFGCLMTVSAADEAGTLAFSAGESTNVELTKAKIDLTITLSDFDGFTTDENGIIGGIAAGQVELDLDENLTITSIKPTSGTKINGENVTLVTDVEVDELENDGNGFVFNAANSDDIYYSQITFELIFKLDPAAQNGDKFTVTATSASIASPYEVVRNVNGDTGTIVMGCDHKLEPVGEPIITDTVNGYAVYDYSICTGKCGNKFGKQVVPTKLPGVIEKLEYDYTQPEDGDRYFDSQLADSEAETGESWETAIIIDSALELTYLTRYAGDKTKGKYYKVADGISGFDMSGGKINRDGTLDENFDAITTSGKRHDAGEIYFQGHFDGNGATVYGLWTKYSEAEGITQKAAGLFAYAKGDVTIKNINVSLSYLKAKSHAGGIVGAYSFDTAIGANDGNKLTIECCSVTDCHIETATDDNASYANGGGMLAATGAIYGAARCYSGDWNGVVKVSNCFINLDEAHFVSLGETDATANSIHGGIGGVAVSQKATFDNCVVIGVAPYSVFNTEYTPPTNVGNAHQHTFLRGRFSNIYTTAAVTGVTSGGVSDNCKTQDYTGLMYQISANQIKGADAKTNMPNLTWDSVWEIDVNRGYPKFKQAETPDLVSETSDLKLALIGTNITYNNGGDYNYNFYYRPNATYTSKDVSLYVAQLNEDGKTLGSFHHLTGTTLSADAAAAVDKYKLQAGDVRFTIERLSAREIYNTLLATAIAVKGGEVLWGETDDFSIAETEQKIIDGNYDTADKNLAEAVLKYGRASKAALNTKNDAKAGTILYWNGDLDSNLTDEVHDYSTQTGDDAANPIIIDTAAELASLISSPKDVSNGKYFKIADDIDKIVLQGETYYKDIIALDSPDAVKDYFKNIIDTEKAGSTLKPWVGNTWNPATMCFSGNFDGNGVEIYGMYASDGLVANTGIGTATTGGLFSIIDGATISNLTLKNSYANVGSADGGSTNANSSNNYRFGLLASYGEGDRVNYINNCIVTNNYAYKHTRLGTSGKSFNYSGVVFGGGGTSGVLIMQNLLVYGNDATGCFVSDSGTEEYDLPIIGNTRNGLSASSASDVAAAHPEWVVTDGGGNFIATVLEDSIILGTPLFAVLSDGTTNGALRALSCNGTYDCFENVYTDWDLQNISSAAFNKDSFLSKGGYPITESQAMGVAAVTNMPKLDWTGTWCYGTTYPSLAKGTYSSSSEGKTIYWEGGTDSNLADGDSNQTGADADHAIIIDSAEELAYLVRDTSVRDYAASVVTVEDKYYKIADGIGAIVLQPKAYVEEIMALDSAAEVKDYFSDTSKTFLEWAGCEGWETGSFAGTFDGNGVTIYGLYGDPNSTNGNKGLFSTVDAGATFKNFTIKNAYLHTTKANFNVGAIACVSCDGSYGDIGDGFVWADRCAVVNSYIRNDCDSWMRSGIMFGTLKGNKGEAAYFDNCLVYGNDAAYGQNDTPMAILGSAKNDISDETAVKIPNGLEPVKASDGLYRSMVRNSIVIGATPYIVAAESYRVNDKDSFVNVYTDAETQNVVRGDGSTVTYDKGQITQITDLSQLVGNNASDIVSTLNAGNGGKTVWYTGKGTILGFDSPTEMIESAQTAYDAITFTSSDLDNYGDSDLQFGIYATSLNLKTNPYISFAFAFNSAYKRDRNKITVTFEYTVDDDTSTTADNDADTDTTKDGIQLQKTTTVPAYEQGKVLNQGGWENSASAGRYHIYRFDDIPVEALNNPIEVTVSYAGGLAGDAKTVTGSFSVKGFALELINSYKQTPSTYYQTRIEAVKALLFYTQMLQARYGA